MKKLALGLTAVFLLVTMVNVIYASDVPRIEKDDLKEMLGSADLIVVDVRTGADWNSSEFKIKGAVREDPGQVSKWMTKYPSDKTLVFYCA